jgi:hypothetical protein
LKNASYTGELDSEWTYILWPTILSELILGAIEFSDIDGAMDGFAFICGSIEPLSDIFAIPLSLPISCDLLSMDLQLVPEHVGLSQVLPSQAVLPQVSGLHVIEAIDILPSDIDMLASLIDISDVITIFDVIECDVLPDDIESCLPVNFPNAATEAPRTKTLATPSQTFCVFIFILPYSTN